MDNQDNAESARSDEAGFPARVFVTGASGFVGTAVVRELVARGHRAVCLVRDREKLAVRTAEWGQDRMDVVEGDLFDGASVSTAVAGAEAAVHLVGIIAEQRLRGQTFERIHVEGTRRVVAACRAAGVRRIVYVSALGARAAAVSRYHRTKWAAEEIVRGSGLDWTILRPSVIHGPDGEFMRLLKTLACRRWVPMMPYFGDGQHRIQPVSVRDVAHCVVASLSRPETVGRAFDLGGPEAMSWKELYRVCRETLPGAKLWKPVVGQPVPVAKLMARTVMRLPIVPQALRFNVDQVQMSQEDSVCDVGPAAEAFGIKLRDFRRELREYAALIG